MRLLKNKYVQHILISFTVFIPLNSHPDDNKSVHLNKNTDSSKECEECIFCTTKGTKYKVICAFKMSKTLSQFQVGPTRSIKQWSSAVLSGTANDASL